VAPLPCADLAQAQREPVNADRVRELVSMAELNQRTLSRLADRGEIGPHQPYHRLLREVHAANVG